MNYNELIQLARKALSQGNDHAALFLFEEALNEIKTSVDEKQKSLNQIKFVGFHRETLLCVEMDVSDIVNWYQMQYKFNFSESHAFVTSVKAIREKTGCDLRSAKTFMEQYRLNSHSDRDHQ